MPQLYRSYAVALISIAALLSSVWYFTTSNPSSMWTTGEINILRSLWINSLPPLPPDTSNSVADHPLAAQFGYQLYFDPRLSANGKISCATCHQAELFFSDGLKVAVGAMKGTRNSMSLIGAAYSPWQFWDGRKDSLWSQALSPLENSLEHAGSRMQYAHLISQDQHYYDIYEKLFGSLPNFSDRTRFPPAAGPVSKKAWNDAWQSMSVKDQETVTKVFVNIGKSINAYERLLLPGPSRFDVYANAIINNDITAMSTLNRNEVTGLKLFIGKAQCINCHNGPLFTNNEFHNTGILSSPGQLPSMGRAAGVKKVRNDTLNCLGTFSDTSNGDCAELRFTRIGDELIGAHKVPSLRNVAKTNPYMHAGQLEDLAAVIDHYNRAPVAMVGHNEIKPLNLNAFEIQQLEAFLQTLTGPPSIDSKWLKRPEG